MSPEPLVFIEDITGGKEPVKISFINEKNYQKLPDSVTYIPNVILTSESVEDAFESISVPCKCEELCDSSCSCHYGSTVAYNGNVLTEDFLNDKPRPIMECSDWCSCKSDCPNRLVQNGITINLQVFMTECKGFGVRTLELIPKNTFVCEYAGELIDQSEAEKRSKNKPLGVPNYIYTAKEHCSDGTVICTIIDPTKFGNIGRYFNHSCSANLFALPIRANNITPRICFFADCDILPYEELTYNYCVGVDHRELFDLPDGVLRECLCQSPECSGFVPLDVKCFP